MVRPSTGCSFHSDAHLGIMMIKGDMIAGLSETFAKYEEKDGKVSFTALFISNHTKRMTEVTARPDKATTRSGW